MDLCLPQHDSRHSRTVSQNEPFLSLVALVRDFVTMSSVKPLSGACFLGTDTRGVAVVREAGCTAWFSLEPQMWLLQALAFCMETT